MYSVYIEGKSYDLYFKNIIDIKPDQLFFQFRIKNNKNYDAIGFLRDKSNTLLERISFIKEDLIIANIQTIHLDEIKEEEGNQVYIYKLKPQYTQVQCVINKIIEDLFKESLELTYV
jgi:hypothetical protein